MQTIIIPFLILASLLNFIACGVEVRDREQSKTESPTEVLKSILTPRPGFSVTPMQGEHFTIFEGANPMEYSVELRPPTGSAQIERFGFQDQSLKQLSVTDSNFDREVVSGQSYEYRFFSANREVLAQIRIDIPKDEVITTAIQLSGARQYRRLYLSATAVITTESSDLDLKAESLIAEVGAKIQTFANGTKASSGLSGRSGGSLRLQVLRAEGELHIEMRGEDGGDGAHGIEFGTPAATGASFDNSQLGFSFPGGAHTCMVNRFQGGSGEDGATGNSGQNGGRGGDSGSLEIAIQDAAEFRVQKSFVMGAGGTPGQGGRGQIGGSGGTSEPRNYEVAGTYNTTYAECPALANGAKGRDGLPGVPGARGGDGEIKSFRDTSCVLQEVICP